MKRWRGKRPLILAVSILALLYGGYRYALHRYVVQARAMLVAAGVPVTPEGLKELYPDVPDDENAATIYKQAFAAFSHTVEKRDVPIVGDVEYPDPGQPWPEAMKESTRAYLEANRSALDLLHQAAARPQSRFIDDPNSFVLSGDMGYFSEQREAARLLKLAAIFHSVEGEASAAADSLLDALAFVRALQQEPLICPQLIRMGCEGIALSAILEAVNRVDFTSIDLVSLDQSVSTLMDNDGTVQSIACECYCMTAGPIFRPDLTVDVYATRPGLKEAAQDGFAFAKSALEQVAGIPSVDLAIYMATTSRIVEGSRRPFPECLRAMDATAELERVPRWVIPNSRMMLQVITGTVEAEARYVAYRRMTKVALALERYRIVEGHYPERLEELVPAYLPEVLIDPFDGKPIRFKPEASDLLVYSIGRDGQDGGGDQGSEDKRASDIVYVLKRKQ